MFKKRNVVVTLTSVFIVSLLTGIAPSNAVTHKTSYPLTISNCGYKVTFKKAPSKVIIMNAASVGEVETFITLGLQSKILANAQHYGVSDDPTMVAKIDAIPTDGLTSNATTDDISAEQILKRKPDLVISTWFGGFTKQNGFNSRDDLSKVGINSIVNPTNCANGNPNPTAAEKATYAGQSIDSSYRFITLLGQIFDVQDRASSLIASLKAKIAALSAKVVGGNATTTGIVIVPDMSMMNTNGLPAVFAGGIYDSILSAAGVKDVFSDKPASFVENTNTETLSTINPTFIILNYYIKGEDVAGEAAKIFKTYPNWTASKNKAYVVLSDSLYLGPLNYLAIEKIAKIAYPSKF